MVLVTGVVSAPSAAIRTIAVGHRQNVSLSVSYDSFGAQFLNRSDLHETRFSATNPDGSLRPAVIVFGEMTGLTAAFIGSRGTVGRSAATLEAGMLDLALKYPLQMAAYALRFPGASFANLLELSLTDVMWRALNGTFSQVLHVFQ